MINSSTKRPLYVSTDGDAGPYIMVPVQQLEELRRLLDKSNVAYWVDEGAISLNGKPEITVVNLRRNADADAVQRLLDNAP